MGIWEAYTEQKANKILNSNVDEDILVSTNGTGVLSVLGTTNYEDNITADDDIPNKKYVDDNDGGNAVRTIISSVINLKSAGTTSLYTVPTGSLFLLNEMEVVTSVMDTPGTAPTVSFGKIGTLAAYWTAAVVNSNAVGERHIIQNPQQGIAMTTVITATVTSGSTATEHEGYFILRGTLLELPVV